MTFRNPGMFFGRSLSQDRPLVLRPLPEGVVVTSAVLEPCERNTVGGKSVRSIAFVAVGAQAPVAVCSFVAGAIENVQLRLQFERGTDVTFSVRGPGTVHLAGRRLFDEEEEEGRPVGQEEEEDEQQPVVDETCAAVENADGDGEEELVEEEEEVQGVNDNEEEEEENEDGGAKKKRRRAREGQEVDSNELKTIRIRGEDLQYVDLSKGGGKPVKRGNKIRIRYTGRFASNNKIFDTSGRKCYSFVAGKGEVIQGLDAGVKGMLPGGKRRIFIPSELAYGAEGAMPDIPPNAALVFEVEMVGYGHAMKKARNQKRQQSPPRLD